MTQPATRIDNFFQTIRSELVAPLLRVADLARRIEELHGVGYAPPTQPGQKMFRELAETSRRSAVIIRRLADLGEILGEHPLSADERVLLADSLRRTAAALGAQAKARQIAFWLLLDGGHLAPVYGSAYWIDILMQILLEQLIRDRPAGANVQMTLTQEARRQTLAIEIDLGPAAGNAIRLADTQAPPIPPTVAIPQPEALDLVLAKAITDRHGGTLEEEQDEQGGFRKFRLALPTGKPYAMRSGDCAQCPLASQLDQFARDFGELLKAESARPWRFRDD
mgnify:CR=1 FL=1